MKEIKGSASHIGNSASLVLSRKTRAAVSGTSRQGIYLQPENDLVLFLSLERYRGPLTINLKNGLERFEEIQTGDQLLFHPSENNFEITDQLIDLQSAKIWNPPLPDQIHSRNLITRRINNGLQTALDLATNQDSLPLLISIQSRNDLSLPQIPGFAAPFNQFLKEFSWDNIPDAGKPLLQLIGLGPGLTPLGDDFLLGILLCLNRWGSRMLDTHQVEALNQLILETAWEKTTRLSASLLVCAVSGRADERIISVLDSYFSGEMASRTEFEDLLAWGSSSGLAVLAGMHSILTRLPI